MRRAPPMTPIRSAGAASRASAARPRASDQRAVVSPLPPGVRTSGLAEAVGVVDVGEVEAALVAQPAPVDRVDVDPAVAQEVVPGRLDGHPAADRAGGAGRLGVGQVPGAGPEAERLGRQGADRADLDGVAAEVGREGVVREGVDLGRRAPADEGDQRVAGHLVGEAGAAVTEDAALPVHEDQVAERDGLGVVALLLDEAALAGAVGDGLVLQGALAALVADRAVQRVVDEEELEDAVLGLLGGGAAGCPPPCRGPPRSCRRAAAPGPDRCRCRRCTCGTCRPTPCAGGSRSGGCRSRPARPRR